MNQLVISLIVLLIPGLIAALVYDSITQHEKWNNFTFSVAAILFGWFSYLPLYLINWLFSVFSCLYIKFRFKIFAVLLDLLNNKPMEESIYIEIFIASIFAFFIACFVSTGVNHKWLTRFANKYGISDKYGDESLFYYYLNIQGRKWVSIRDSRQNKIYTGGLNSYSEQKDNQEIVLIDVDVYFADGSSYHLANLYICGKIGDFSIEPLTLKQ